MDFIVTYEGKEYRIEAVEKGSVFQVKIDGEPFEIDVLPVTDSHYSFLIRGRSYEVNISGRDEACSVLIGGESFDISILEERKLRLRAALKPGEAAAARQLISTPMPGKVVKVLVSPGDTVKAGTGIIVVEAMKMQNELKAKGPGTVKEVRAQEGQGVEGGAVLVVIE